MTSVLLKRSIHFFIFYLMINTYAFSAAGDLSQSFTLEGELYDSPTGTSPFTGAAEIQIRILDPSKNCVLYAESQMIDTTTSNGIFNIEVGSSVVDPDGKRIGGSDSGNSMAQVYQNTLPINATGAGCGGPTFTPAVGGGDGRYLEIAVTPTASGLTDILGPEIFLGSVPSAVTSQTLQGLYPSNFAILKPGTTELTQANLEDIFSLTNFPVLQALIAGGGAGSGTSSTTNTILNADSDNNTTGAVQFAINSSVKAEVKNDGDFAVDSNTFYVEAASNRVGIGSTVPSFDLSFGGDVDRILGLERHSTANTAGNDITVQSGGATTGATDKTGGDLYLASGTATGTGSSNVYIQTATAAATGVADNAPTTKMTILGRGSVGIGTTTPTSVLEVSRNAGATFALRSDSTTIATFERNEASGSPPKLYFNKARGTGASRVIVNNADTTGSIEFNGYDGAGFIQSARIQSFIDAAPGINSMSGRLTFGTTASGGTSSTEHMRIDSLGNVGIGTTSPTAALHLKAGTAAVNTAPLKLTAGVNLTTPEAGAIEFDGTNLYFTDSTNARKTVYTGTAGTGDFLANGTVPMTAGLVGIAGAVGTPSFTFTGDLTTGIYRAGAGQIGIATGGLASFKFLGNASNAYMSAGKMRGASGVVGNPTYGFENDTSTGIFGGGGTLGFSVGGTDRMNITAGGLVGIGITSSTYKLDVNGDIRIAAASSLYVGTTAMCDSTGCTAAPSDRRYKKNILPLLNSYENIQKLNAVTYDWKDKKAFGKDHQVGFIAQDIEKVFPEVVKTDKKSGFKSVMYDKLVAPLVEAFKSLVARLNKTDARVNELEKENTARGREIASVKSENQKLKSEIEEQNKRLLRLEQLMLKDAPSK